MKWGELLKIINPLNIVETSMLTKNVLDVPQTEVQLSRWVKAGKLIKVRRGIYLLADPYRKEEIHYDYLAILAYRPSYVSLEYALADYGLIPEAVSTVTAVTTKRPYRLEIGGKKIIYRHVKPSLFWGYESRNNHGKITFYAKPEKALLDLLYFTSGKIDETYLTEMRFQNLEILNLQVLTEFADRFKSSKIKRVVKILRKYVEKQKGLKEL